ncbi:MAG: hypothetical protein JXR41_09890 [Bacteroidales bacterium]|nr:hypothetical protein [Bacteroidales bacterium]
MIIKSYPLLILFCVTGIIKAQDSIPDSLVKERIQVIQEMLDQGKKNANIWWYGWIAGYGTATLAQGAVCLYSEKLATRQDMALGALTTLLGVGSQLIAPMDPGFVPDRLREIPEGNPEQNLIKLQEAERMLEACAVREKEGRSWKIHALDGAVNVACGFVVWFGFKRTFTDGLINVAMNTAICEAQIFTQPTRAIRDYDNYCRQYKTGQPLSVREPKASWSFTIVPGGVGVRLVF